MQAILGSVTGLEEKTNPGFITNHLMCIVLVFCNLFRYIMKVKDIQHYLALGLNMALET
jgi:hypothetical protein